MGIKWAMILLRCRFDPWSYRSICWGLLCDMWAQLCVRLAVFYGLHIRAGYWGSSCLHSRPICKHLLMASCRSLSYNSSVHAITFSCEEFFAHEVIMALLGRWTLLSLIIDLHDSLTNLLVSCALRDILVRLRLRSCSKTELLSTTDSLDSCLADRRVFNDCWIPQEWAIAFWLYDISTVSKATLVRHFLVIQPCLVCLNRSSRCSHIWLYTNASMTGTLIIIALIFVDCTF